MQTLKKWLPALLIMAIIFAFSSIPSDEMPRFGLVDYLVKKSGHAWGYAMLAISYLRGLGWRRTWLAWAFAILFAISDEVHQSFVPGRNPSFWDILIFDNLGALAGLWVVFLFSKRKHANKKPEPPSWNSQ